MTELARLDGIAEADLVARGEVTRCRARRGRDRRAEDLNPALNAWSRQCSNGRSATRVSATGPLAGVPMLLKDLIAEVEGVRFTEGSRFLADNVSTYTSGDRAPVRSGRPGDHRQVGDPRVRHVSRVRGRTVRAYPQPLGLTRSTSGSSGGSAAAVAAGIVPIADAKRSGGSIRYPASNCGLFGLKPTRARNPLGPEYGDAISGWAVEHVVTRQRARQRCRPGRDEWTDAGRPRRRPRAIPAVPPRGRCRSGPPPHRIHLTDEQRRARAPRPRRRAWRRPLCCWPSSGTMWRKPGCRR